MWDTECTLELALGTGTGSCRRLGLSGLWQNDKLTIPQHRPYVKFCPLSYRQSLGFLVKKGCPLSPDIFSSPAALILVPQHARDNSSVHNLELNTCQRASRVHMW